MRRLAVPSFVLAAALLAAGFWLLDALSVGDPVIGSGVGHAVIEGGALHAGEADSAGDHRCAMSFCVAGLVSTGPVYVLDCANIATSFPGFFELANSCGFSLA